MLINSNYSFFDSSVYSLYSNQSQNSVFFNLDKLKVEIDTLFGSLLSRQVSVLITGSDARKEANPQLKKYEMIIVYSPETNLDDLNQKLKIVCEKFHEYLDTDIELRPQNDAVSFGHFKDSNNNSFVFPTRCLDSTYLTGNKEIELQYKSIFLNQLRQNQFSLSEFKRKRFKDAKKQLKQLVESKDPLNAAKIKHSAVRAIQYYVALKILEKFKDDESLSVSDLLAVKPDVESRLEQIENPELVSLYRQCLTTYHYYALAQDRSLDVSKTNKDLIDVAKQINTFFQNN